MQKNLLLILLAFWTYPAIATHIVGGEIDLQRVNNQGTYTHRVSLNLYFDDINGNLPAIDNTITLGFFRKKDNQVMGYVTMPITNNNLIGYTNPQCGGISTLRTRLIQYSTLIVLQASVFNDPDGYYIVWDRCCRNNIISNIVNPAQASSLFYLEFPPLTIDNSSPKFKELKGDYICINRPFTFDFSATDADSDSLVYSLVTPLSGFSTTQVPKPDLPTGSSNYPVINWASGYSNTNAIPGSRPLSVNRSTGLLTVTAGQLGLFVFCVLTEEYRNGKKIGAVRRDFQLKVVDCASNDAPQSFVKVAGESAFYKPSQTIYLKKENKDKCFNLYFTDPNPSTELTIKAIATNFTDANLIKIPNTYFVQTSKDTLKTQVCLDACSESIDGKPLVFQLITADNGCPQQLIDTLTVKVIVEPQTNNKPSISTDLGKNRAEATINTTLKFNVLGNDIDNDQIKIEAIGRGFSLAQAGMSFAGASGIGSASSPFVWSPLCSSIRKDDYIVDFVVTDTRCNRSQQDTIAVAFKPLPIDSKAPSISTTLPKNQLEIILDGEKTHLLNFDVLSKDPENDPIKVYAQPINFSLSAVGANWANKDGIGSINAPFSWQLSCDLLQDSDAKTFTINFVTEDNSCSPIRFDTVQVEVVLKNKIMDYEFKPANVFTPNNDGKNDYFAIDDLPENSCFEKFEYIQIFNRWGQSVYQSFDRLFQWYGENLPASDYYYVLKFTKKEFKGWITLLR